MPDLPPAPNLPAFTPVPRARTRHNGWSPATQSAFIDALAETGSVRAACRRIGRSDNGAYQLRRHPDAGEFRAAWDDALALAVRRIEDAAMDRALYGTEETIHYHGEHVGTRRRYNERLVMFMLRNRAPDRFTEGRAKALSALDQATLKKLRKEWEQEWERARMIAADAAYDRQGRDFKAAIEQQHRSWWANLGPRTRAAYREFRRLEREESDGAWRLTDGQYDDDEAAAAEAEYTEVFARDGRARIDLLRESEAIGDDQVLGENADEPDLPPGFIRIRSWKDQGD